MVNDGMLGDGSDVTNGNGTSNRTREMTNQSCGASRGQTSRLRYYDIEKVAVEVMQRASGGRQASRRELPAPGNG